MSEVYTLDELTERAGRVLDGLGVQVGNRRVRQRPDARTVRYYSQHGLVDRPLAVGGREARYGRRHLAQVVAVKRLQAAGVSLAEIQRKLAGAADRELLAAIGPGAGEALEVGAAPADQAPARRVESADGAPAASRVAAFWQAPPAAPAPAVERAQAGSDTAARRLLAVPLAAGVELTIDVTGRDAVSVDASDLRAATRPLVEQLRDLGVCGADDEHRV